MKISIQNSLLVSWIAALGLVTAAWAMEEGAAAAALRKIPGQAIIRQEADAFLVPAFSPDLTRIATVSTTDENTAIIWDTRTRNPILQLRGHAGSITAMAFSTDGKKLATASSDNSLIIWNVQTGDKLHQFSIGFSSTILAFSPDGLRLATGSNDNTAIIWDARTGISIFQLRVHAGVITALAFSPDGEKLATGSGNSTIIWDTRMVISTLQLQGNTDEIYSLAFSPDSTALAVAGDETAIIWNAQKGQQIQKIEGSDEMFSVAFSRDGLQLATGSEGENAIIWDVQTGIQQYQLTGHTHAITNIAFSLDGTEVAAGSDNGDVTIWNMTELQELEQLARGLEHKELLSQLKGEDRIFTRPEKDFSFFGVFDGHIGKNAVDFFSQELSKKIMEDVKLLFVGNEFGNTDKVKEIIKNAVQDKEQLFKELNPPLLRDSSGTTAAMAIVSHDDDIFYVANVGDSKVVLSRRGQAVALTQDHVPDNRLERKRFEDFRSEEFKNGISINETRLYCKPKDTWIEGEGVYPLTRSLGAIPFKKRWQGALIAEPDVIKERITPEDQFLILASDGLWDWVEPQVAVDVVSRNLGNLEVALQELKETVKRAASDEMRFGEEQCDDLAIIIVKFIHEQRAAKRKAEGEPGVELVDEPA